MLPALALAQSASPLPAASTAGQTTAILTGIQNDFIGSMGGWLSHATSAAQDLFTYLAVFELMWVGIQWALKRPEPHELIGSLSVKVAFFALFYFGVIGMAPHWVPLLLNIFHKAGLVVTGMSGQQANALTPANPSAIFGQSWDAIKGLTAAVSSQLSLMHPLDDTLMGLSAVASAIVFILAYALLAFEALIINIEASVILGAGIFMLAFAGSNWTTTFSEKYLSYVFSIGVKYFVLTVILALGAGLPTTIQHVFAAMQAQGGYSWTAPIAASFMTLVYGVVGLTAPGIAGSMLSGSPSLSTGSFMGAAAGGAGAAMGAAGAAAGVAGLAGSGAAGLAAMARRLGGGASAVGGIAGDMGAMGMLGAMAGTNRGAGGGGGGVAGLARATGTGSRGAGQVAGQGMAAAGKAAGKGVAAAGSAAGAALGAVPGLQPVGAAVSAGSKAAGAGIETAGKAAGEAAKAAGRAGGAAADKAGGGGAGTAGGGSGAAGAAPSGTSAAAKAGTDGIADPGRAGSGSEGAGETEKAGKGFFSRTTAEHAMNVAKHASKGLGHAQDALRHQGQSGGINIRLNHPE
jgi:type IV secretion system protein TrbL